MSRHGQSPDPVRRDALAAQAAELLAGLGRDPAPSGPFAARQPNGGTGVRRLTIALTAVLLLGVVYMLATGQWRVRSATVPAELIGVWSTTAPSHADRRFEITDSTLVLHTGGTDSTVSEITDVRAEGSAEDVTYTVEYLLEEARFLFSFTLAGGADGVIRFRNQPAMEWRRQR